MNKKELAKKTSQQLNLTQKECLNCINAITSLIYQSLSRGEDVQIYGFGKFSVKTRKEKTTINPYTKQPMLISSKNIPVFKSGKEFKDCIR